MQQQFGDYTFTAGDGGPRGTHWPSGFEWFLGCAAASAAILVAGWLFG